MHPFPQGFGGEVYWPRILASALALALTGAIMVLLHVNHPPAGATTMIVSLGILAKPEYLVIIEIAVVLLAAQAFIINRLAGLQYPIWRSHP
jgi:CBS domain-containing membrane protein